MAITSLGECIRLNARSQKMFLLLVAALSLQAEQPMITFESPCISTPALMAELSKQAGEPLYVIGEPAKYDQAVRFDHVPLGTVMARLAEAHAGEWVKRGEGFQLQRSSAAIDAEQVRLRKAAIAGIAKKQKDSREQLEKMGRLDRSTADTLINKIRDIKVSGDGTPDFTDPVFQNAGNFGPGKRTALELCLAFTPEDLASMEPGSHIVFSTNPNAAERRLPDSASTAIGEMVEAEKYMVDVEKALLEKLAPETPMPIPGGTARVLLRLSRDVDSQAFQFNVTSLAETGQQIEQETESIQPEDEPGTSISLAKAKATAEEKQFAVAFNPPPQGGDSFDKPAAPVLTADQKEKLFHIDQYHPGSLVVGPMLLREAQGESKNLLVLLDDQSVSSMQMPISLGQKSIQGFRESAKTSDSWIESYPSDHVDADRIELDKKHFQNFLLSGHDSGSVSLQAQLDLVSQCSEGSLVSNSLTSDYRQLLLVDGEDCFVKTSYLGLVFYGTLTDLQLSQAAKGLSFRALSDGQKNLLSRMIYGENASPLSNLNSMGMGGVNGDTPSAVTSSRFSYTNLPEESLPNGISFNGSLKIDQSSTDSLYFKARTAQGDQSGCVDEASLAYLAADKASTFIALQPAKQDFYLLQFQLSPSIASLVNFKANSPNGERVTRIDQLPKNFQDAISASVEGAEENAAGRRDEWRRR